MALYSEEDAVLAEDMELDGHIVKATLSRSGVIRWTSSSFSDSLVLQDDLLGFSRDHSSLSLFTFRLAQVGCCASNNIRVRKDVVLKFRDADTVESWSQAIQACLDEAERPKRLLVILNPFGGKKRAKELFQQHVEPLLSAAGVACTLQETQYQNHAREVARSMDPSQYDGIVCVSGDGVLAEVCIM
ncbi:hypothetical protein L7F22_027748 [Adiantum nelumboides]|nr:hypothetical protein [Adiantum nelumboides]